MKMWLRRIRGAVAMGLTWAAGWTLVGMLGVVVFYTLFPNVPDVFDVWIPVFAYSGFFGGVIFSAVLRIAEGGRRFDELSLPRIAVWGRWLVWCWACCRLSWGHRAPNSRCGCWLSE